MEQKSFFKIFIVFSFLSFLGILSIPNLSIRLNPSKSLPSLTINYNWPNISPSIMEMEVSSKLESKLSTLKGLKKINSTSSFGTGSVLLEFDKYTNINSARFETASIIRQLYPKLPEKLSYPSISLNKSEEETNSKPFLIYSINAPESSFLIHETLKNEIQPIIGAIKDVDKTIVFGATPKEFIINYNFQLLKKLKISKEDIINAIRQKFDRESLGNIKYRDNYINLSIKTVGDLKWDIPIIKNNDRIIYLKDISQIKEQEQEAQRYFRINGKNAISLSIYATKDANTIVLAKKIATNIKEIQKKIPDSYSVIESYNSTNYLKKELDKIYERSLFTILILLLFILIVSKSLRYLLLTIICLVVNISIAFFLYYLFEVEIQIYSLAGITISLGLVIDNIIVMIDHIKNQKNRNVFIPILASTLTTVGALTTIYFLDDIYKKDLIDFALVIIINLSISLLVALFLVPALMNKIPIEKKSKKQKANKFREIFYRYYKELLSRLIKYKKLAIIFIILLFGVPFFLLPQKIDTTNSFLNKTYNNTIGNEWFSQNARPFLDKYLGGSFRLFNYYVFENSYYNVKEETKLYVSASMEKGATVHQMNEAYLFLESYLSQFSEIEKFTSNIYSGDYANMEITFKDNFQESSFPFFLKAYLISKVLNLGGIEWDIYGVGSGFSSGNSINDPINFTVKAKGYNYENLNRWADTLKFDLEKHPRIKQVTIKENSYRNKKTSYQYLLNLDKQKITLKKSNPLDIINELKSLTISKASDLSINYGGKYMPVRMESSDSKIFDLWAIKNTPIDSLQTPIILKSIAEVSKEREEESIYKENQEYIRLVQFQYLGSAKFGSKYLKEKLNELKLKLPLGYKFENSQDNWFFSENETDNYIFLLFFVIVIIYFICAILFESLKQPFIILGVIPISFIGVFLTFYLFDFNFDQGGLASFVLLSGITVNASIFIINAFNKLKKIETNITYVELYIQAFKQKIFPIILTIVSTILGFIPFVKDGQNEVFWFALGAGTIGGLVFSIIGILFYLPLFTLKKKKF